MALLGIMYIISALLLLFGVFYMAIPLAILLVVIDMVRGGE